MEVPLVRRSRPANRRVAPVRWRTQSGEKVGSYARSHGSPLVPSGPRFAAKIRTSAWPVADSAAMPPDSCAPPASTPLTGRGATGAGRGSGVGESTRTAPKRRPAPPVRRGEVRAAAAGASAWTAALVAAGRQVPASAAETDRGQVLGCPVVTPLIGTVIGASGPATG